MNRIIKYIKNKQKQKYLKINNKGHYAFIGIGSHSINNLYPIINYFRINLKYIITKSKENARYIDDNFQNTQGLTDINIALKDDEVKGIFICTQAKHHYELVNTCLKNNKNVFVEKPPCLTLEELTKLNKSESEQKGVCLVGLQKNYSPCNLDIKKKVNGKCSYNYKFLVGSYPEGDPILDIFIHPIALIEFIFGKIKSKNILIKKFNASLSIFMQLEHKNGSVGIAELSTAYSWLDPLESLIINTESGVYEMKNSESLIFKPKAGSILKIPKEKIFKQNSKSVKIVNRNNFNPILQNNQLYSSGYFSEIANFIKICEGKNSQNNSRLRSLISTYEIIDQLKKLI